jgi:hypothetical protein
VVKKKKKIILSHSGLRVLKVSSVVDVREYPTPARVTTSVFFLL